MLVTPKRPSNQYSNWWLTTLPVLLPMKPSSRNTQARSFSRVSHLVMTLLYSFWLSQHLFSLDNGLRSTLLNLALMSRHLWTWPLDRNDYLMNIRTRLSGSCSGYHALHYLDGKRIEVTIDGWLSWRHRLLFMYISPDPSRSCAGSMLWEGYCCLFLFGMAVALNHHFCSPLAGVRVLFWSTESGSCIVAITSPSVWVLNRKKSASSILHTCVHVLHGRDFDHM